MDGKNNGNNGTVPTKEVAPKTEERSPKENNQTKNQKEVGRGNREWKKRKNQDKTLEQPNNQHQHQKTRIHGKTDKKRKPGNAKSKNQHDECQDELQKWPRETQVQILHPETQEHVVQDCQKIKRNNDTIRYAEIFKENNMEKTRAIARALIQINNTLDET